MSRWRIHGLSLCGFLIFPVIAVWADLNGPQFMRWVLTAFVIAVLAVYAGATSAVVAIFKLERRGILILHACVFAVTLVIAGIFVALYDSGPGPQMTSAAGTRNAVAAASSTSGSSHSRSLI